MEIEKLKSMKYADLQRLAKKCGIKANIKCDKLRTELERFYKDGGAVADTGNENSKTDNNTSTTKAKAVKVERRSFNPLNSDNNTPKPFKVQNRELSSVRSAVKPSPKVTPQTVNHIRKNTVDKNTPVASFQNHARKGDKATPVSSIVQNKLHSRKNTPVASNQQSNKGHERKSTYDKDTPSVLPAQNKRHSRSGTYDKQTPVNAGKPDGNKRDSRSGTYDKETPVSNSRKVLVQSTKSRLSLSVGKPAVTEPRRSGSVGRPRGSGSVGRPRGSVGRPRRSDSVGSRKRKAPSMADYISDDEDKKPGLDELVSEDEDSPGVHEMISGMTRDMTHDQMRASLLDALDRRAKKKHNASVTVEGQSMIPRYTALASPGSKKNTPGTTTKLTRIHEKEFNKMESIDDYLERKRKRTESMTTSMKKMKMMTQQMRNVVESVKKYRTPPSLLKKSVVVPAGKSKASLFQSPNNKRFVPTVISTAQANFNFSALKLPPGCMKAPNTPASRPASVCKPGSTLPSVKSPAPRRPFVPTVTSTSKANFNFGARKSPRLSTGAVNMKTESKENRANASVLNKTTGATPFKFSGGGLNRSQLLNRSENTSLHAKARFDLKASLAKPLTWKPHTGKLQGFKDKGLYAQNSRTSTQKTKEQSRKIVQSKQANKRLDQQMSRRGIVA